MSKHTPGPWEVAITGGMARAVFKQGDPGGQICKLPGALFGPDGDTRLANAHVIAAAPEMLAALKDALGFLDCVGIEEAEDNPDLVASLDRMRARYNAIIDKAQGA